MTTEVAILEKKWSFFFDLMDHDKNGRWNLRDFVIFSEKIFTIYAVNNLVLDVNEFVQKSRRIFMHLLKVMKKDKNYITKKEWIEFLYSQHDQKGSRFFNIMIYMITRELFEVCDQNGDDYLSEMELIQMYKILGLSEQTAIEAMELLDLNRDHKVSKYELYKGVKAFFEDPDRVFTLFGHVYALSDEQIVE